MGGKYPRPYIIDGEPTNYMAFPILRGQRLWSIGQEAGRFRIVYHKFDGAFYRVVMHRNSSSSTSREAAGLGLDGMGIMHGHDIPLFFPEKSAELLASPFPSCTPFSPRYQNPTSVIHTPMTTCPSCKAQSPIPELDAHPIPHRLNSAPSPRIPRETHAPLVKVKSAPGSLRESYRAHPPRPERDVDAVLSSPVAISEFELTINRSPLPPNGMPNARSGSNTPRQRFTAPSPSINQSGYFINSPPESRRPSLTPLPLVDEHGLFIKSGDNRRPSLVHTTIPEEETGYTQSPATDMRQRGDSSMIPAPLELKKSYSITASPATSRSRRNTGDHIVGYDPRPPISPRTPSSPLGTVTSLSAGYDPRLPCRSRRGSAEPGQSGGTAPGTPLVKSPAIGLHQPGFRFSPLVGNDTRLIRSPPPPRITFWTEMPQGRRASHA